MGRPPDATGAAGREGGDMTTITHTPLPAALRAAGFVGRLVEPARRRLRHRARGLERRASTAFRRPSPTPPTPTTSPLRSAPAASSHCRSRSAAGGHSVSGRSVRDGALCIDLRALNAVAVDAEDGFRPGRRRRAPRRARRGLAGARPRRPGGQISHTGVGGLTLGGGIGWLMRKPRAHDRLAAGGRGRARRRRAGDGLGRRERRPLLGAPRRRRRLRRRDLVRPTAPPRSAR